MLFDIPSIKTPIHYFGGKTRACRILSEFVPFGIKDIVSPFLGGGSFELYLTGRGIRVYGYDAFVPLVNFWQVLLKKPAELSCLIRSLVLDFRDNQRCRFETATEFRKQASGDVLTNAAQWFILNNLSFRNKGSRRCALMELKIDDEGRARLPNSSSGSSFILYDRIENFQNNLITVDSVDFKESLARHHDTFAYCDPPYPGAECEYGSSGDFQEHFDHEGLAQILHNRDKWVLSYNDTELVRDLYPSSRCKILAVSWSQNRIHHDYKGNDVVITPK